MKLLFEWKPDLIIEYYIWEHLLNKQFSDYNLEFANYLENFAIKMNLWKFILLKWLVDHQKVVQMYLNLIISEKELV